MTPNQIDHERRLRALPQGASIHFSAWRDVMRVICYHPHTNEIVYAAEMEANGERRRIIPLEELKP